MAATREAKHLQRLKALYAAGRFAPNVLDQQGLCHIHHAIYRGYLVCAKWLVKHGSSLTARSAEGSVPAHYAAAGGHLECLKWIHRKASKSISLTDNNGVTPLYFSAQEGHLNCLVWLAKHSGTFSREMSVDGMTAVHAAALEGHLGCLVFLLSSAGCSALGRDRAANTPLHYAAACGRRSCVEWLLGNISRLGNEKNKLGSSPLHVAAQNGHLEVVKLLIRGGVAIKLRDRLGRTPFEVAVESGNEACANFLYQAEGMNGLMSGNHSLKRVRFERKAIERDRRSEQASIHQQSSQASSERKLLEEENTIQTQHLLYKNSVDASVSLNHHGNLRMERDRSNTPKRVAYTDQKYAGRLPQGFDPSLGDLHVKGHATRSSLLPWSRVYRMTQSTESLPSPHQPKVYASYSLSDTNGRDDSSPERQFTSSQHYVVTNYKDVSPEKQNTSFFSRIVSWRKSKDLFPEDFDRFDDIVETSTQRGNFIKRLYKFSKRKVTRSSSFALESLSDNVQRERRNSFVVSGNDEFLSGFVTDPVGDPTRQEGKGEKLDQQTHKVETSVNCMYGIKGDSSKNELKSRGGKKTRKRHTETIPRENSLIW